MASSLNLKDFAVKGIIGAGFGIVVDGIIEISGIPFFNETGIFGNDAMSNYELFAYSIAGGITVLSMLDILLNSKPFGISREALPYSVFFIIGTSLWETTLAKMVGLRNVNIYQMLQNQIPNLKNFIPQISFPPAAAA